GLDRQQEGLMKNLAGIKDMKGLPDMLFIIDVRKEEIAVAEANRLGIPVVAVVDTNCSPEGVDHVIPGNDDALRAIRLFASRIADAILEGQNFGTEGSGSFEEGAAETTETETPAVAATPVETPVAEEIAPEAVKAAEPTETVPEAETENTAEVAAESTEEKVQDTESSEATAS
ncbi:MAG: 30S ribosomal protein S2, partial [Actinomycetota bacterium]